MNFYTAGKYLNYKLFSSHRRGHGVHSPFLFHLITDVIRNKTSVDIVLNIESTRKRMISDKRTIMVTDWGSGAKRKGGELRNVSDIAINSSVPLKYGKLLSNLSGEFGGSSVLEMGTSLGISAMFLAAGAPHSVVHTIEGCREVSAIARENIKSSGYKNIVQHTGRFGEILPLLKEEGLVPGLIFIDGDHRKEKVLEYFEQLCDMSDEKTVMVFDDIHSSRDMGSAWESLTTNARVTLSVELFRMGIIFFKKGLTPSAYVIRY